MAIICKDTDCCTLTHDYDADCVSGDSTPPQSNQMPSIRNILDAIENDHLTLTYARWQNMPSLSEPFLELAYWIGQNPGNPLPQDRDEARDRSNQVVYAERDQWVVFHIPRQYARTSTPIW